MNTQLIITEKPSVAKNIASILGAAQKRDGYKGGGYLISWCVGHLLGLAAPEAYGKQYANWCYADLPIVPKIWKNAPAWPFKIHRLSVIMGFITVKHIVRLWGNKRTEKVNIMNDEVLRFPNRVVFREWLNTNATSSDGVWLLFGKKSGPITLTAGEALEEALCFGWIDGQMQSLDSSKYKKYFARRMANSKWSEKNKALAEKLETQGLMTDYGRVKIEEAKKNGQWDKPKAPPITDEQIATFSDLLKEHEPAYANFQAMSPSIKKTYTRAYFDAKTDAGRASRLSWIIERLNQNLKPM